jgi:hypothetical protein
VSALRRNCCPDSAGMSVRFAQEYAVKDKTTVAIILNNGNSFAHFVYNL